MVIVPDWVSKAWPTVLFALGGCAPEVGSQRWCEALEEQPRGDWTVNEALDYARHCIVE